MEEVAYPEKQEGLASGIGQNPIRSFFGMKIVYAVKAAGRTEMIQPNHALGGDIGR